MERAGAIFELTELSSRDLLMNKSENKQCDYDGHLAA